MSEDKEQIQYESVNNDELTNKQSGEDIQAEDNDILSEQPEPDVDWKEKYDDLNNTCLRLHAEFDNYRKRTLKEKSEILKTAGENIMTGLL
ncbi:MAG: nucleotide exchange factor GrpE, partial [Prevotella sp.]|nr:nucleotide exchange factor GrpE [Prevotella sp.]